MEALSSHDVRSPDMPSPPSLHERPGTGAWDSLHPNRTARCFARRFARRLIFFSHLRRFGHIGDGFLGCSGMPLGDEKHARSYQALGVGT